jgi:hypothetical protein
VLDHQEDVAIDEMLNNMHIYKKKLNTPQTYPEFSSSNSQILISVLELAKRSCWRHQH